MFSLRRRQPHFAWLAILAMLAMALLPTVAHALAHARGDSPAWAEVCTPQGMRLVAVPADEMASAEDKAPLQAAGHLEHCPLCMLAQGMPALPGPPAPALPLVAPAQPVPSLFLHAPRTLHAWRSADARGPPRLS